MEDSSSDENDEMLREALDSRMFTVADIKGNKEIETPKSYKDNILNVTPAFQNFVAKRLSGILDKTIEEFQREDCHFEPDLSTGIRLFSDSKCVLENKIFVGGSEIKSGTALPKNKKLKAKHHLLEKDDENESDRMKKVRDAAVSVEWVLNGEGTKGWSKPRGQLFAYRKNKNGVLEVEE